MITKRLFTRVKIFCASLLSILLVLSTAGVSRSQNKEKLKPEDVVAKHLEAIGPADARAALKTMVVVGTVDATFRSRSINKISGTAALASDGDKNLISLVFDAADYPFERIGFNGQKVTGADIQPGRRSPLINFLLGYDAIIRQGLLGGSLSTAWPMHRLAEKNPKLEYGGLKKMEGRQVHELRYQPRKGSDIKVSLFFDAETFQHVRTEYSRSVAGQMGTNPDNSASASQETRYKMVEEFSDFKTEGKLMLPHDYKLSFVIATPRETLSFEWAMKMTQFNFNQPIAEKEFSVAVADK